jgi:serine/threonine protein kinase/lipoprotein NlpI
MSACPSDDLLLEMLNERLQGPKLAEIVIHVETCRICQEQLENLTRGRGWKTTVPEGVGERRPEARDTPGLADQEKNGGSAEGFRLARDGDSSDKADSAGGSTAQASTDLTPDDPERTHSRLGNRKESAWSQRPGYWPDSPKVPGYEILEQLGEGGMGVVYKARQVGLNRMVALKMIRGGSQARPDHFVRFSIEAEAVARLRHPNILQIYDIGAAENLPFVSLELLEGGSLADRLEGTPQPGRPSAELLATLAMAIEAAHQAGIVHRDLKPSNVLFTDQGTPKITDFGLAKRLESDSRQTESGQIMGSPSYMAPEQARGNTRDVGPAADVYALGAILYEMLTGRPPFKGETPMETIRQVIDDDAVPPSRLVPRIDRDLETICLKCLQKESHKRYESAQAFAGDLGRYQKREPIKARPASLWDRGSKWARRRPIAATFLGLGIAGALLGLVGGVLFDRASREQERQQNTQDIANQQASSAELFQADAERQDGDLDAANSRLNLLRGKIEKDPKQRVFYDRARAGLREIDQLRAERLARAADRDRYEKFRRQWNEASFHATQFTGLDVPTNQEATRRAALAALRAFAGPFSRDSWTLGPLPPSLPERERAEVKEACYSLLLSLADVSEQPVQGLRYLEMAARLHGPDAAYHLQRAACLIRAGDQPGAQRERREAEAIRPTTASEYFFVGRDLFKRGDPIAANRHFDSALRLQPDHFWANCLSAVCYLRTQQPRVAKAILTACIERERGYAWLYVWRGFASSQLAAIASEELKKQSNAARATLREEADHQFEAAKADYDHALALLLQKPDDELRWVLLVNRGLLFVGRADWSSASADLEAAIRLDGRRAEAPAALAQVYQRQRQWDAAFEQYTKAIAVKGDWAPLYRGRAEVELARTASTPDDRKQALFDLEQAIRLESPVNPVLALDHTNRARLLYADHREALALAACDAALAVRPAYKDAHVLRVQLLLDLKRYDEVIRSCDALLAQDKATAAYYELRAMARAYGKDFHGAIEDDTQAIAIEPERALLYARRGGLYLLSEAPKPALHDFEVAVRLDPADADALSGRAAARVRLGRHREAVTDAEKSLALGKPTADRLYRAARIYARSAAMASTEVRKHGQDTVNLVASYLDRGTDLLRAALKKLPAAERAAFWRNVVQSDPDPAMNALRRRIRSMELVGERTGDR